MRFDERGRMLPPGLKFIDSWIAADLRTCDQLSGTDDFNCFNDGLSTGMTSSISSSR